MLRAEDGSAGDEGIACVRGHALLVDVQQILAPGILVLPEEGAVLEQPEPVGDLPLDLELAGVEGLRPRRKGENGQQCGNE